MRRFLASAILLAGLAVASLASAAAPGGHERLAGACVASSGGVCPFSAVFGG